MKRFIKNTFWFKYKIFIQAIVALLIVFISWHPNIYLHPITTAVLIFSCYTLHSYIENKIALKKILHKISKQEKIITTLYKNSDELIIYRDVNGNYIYCNEQYLSTFNLSMDKIKGKYSFEYLQPKDAKEDF
jgi:PAS domain-containing protein